MQWAIRSLHLLRERESYNILFIKIGEFKPVGKLGTNWSTDVASQRCGATSITEWNRFFRANNRVIFLTVPRE